MPEANEHDMKIDNQLDQLPDWEIKQLENNRLVAKEVMQPQFPTFEDNSISLHCAYFD
jgi:hypothetical protein